MSSVRPTGAQPRPRADHLTSATTNRDLYGIVRGSCRGCNQCGRYMIVTAHNYTSAHGSGIHPDNDPSITHCSRCGCPPDAHEAVPWETERELGTDAFALHQWDAAVLHYSRAIDGNPADAALFSNRAAAYIAKGWHPQALQDAERALALKPEWFRPWARKGAALLGLGRPAEAEAAYQRALEVARGQGEEVPAGTIEALETGVGEARMARRKQARVKTAAAAATAAPAARAAATAVRASTPRAGEAPKSGAKAEGLVSTASMRPTAAAAVTPPTPLAAPTLEELLAAAEAKYATVTAELHDLRGLIDRLRLAVEACRPAPAPAQRQEAEAVEQAEAAKRHLAAASGPLPTHHSASEENRGTEDGEVASCNSSSDSGSTADPTPTGAASDGAQSHSSDPFGSPVAASSAASVSEEAPGDSRSDSGTNSDSTAASDAEDDGIDLEWMSKVEAARRELGMGEGSQGFVPPPPTAAASPRRRASHALLGAQEPSTESKLNLHSLQTILEAAAARRRRLDPSGVERGACKTCGPSKCGAYLAATISNGQEDRISIIPGSISVAESLRRCASCGCDCKQHETRDEATRRRASEEHRQRALAAEREAAATQRQRRVAAATARRTAAEAASEPLQSTDCDMLTHSRRKQCTECTECPGFRIYFGPSDANDPSIMFFCSLCGCAAASHAADASWEREEASRREAEAAASAARARAAAAAAAAPAARRAEAEAYAALGLHYGADTKAVTRAYKRLALKLHPDKATGEASAAEFVKVTRAYKLLAEHNF